MPAPHDIDALRARLAGGSGPALWRSLEAVAETTAFKDFMAREFPAASRLATGPDRRQFFRLMAASFAMAGLAACSEDDGRSKEVPYVRNPERILATQPLVYTSAALLDGIANGITVTTRDGRPLKIEGNDRHPWSRGGTDIFAQASILDLYDPFRSQAVRYLNRPSSWQAFRAAMVGQVAALKAKNGGAGFRLLTGPITSPTLLAQIAALQAALPGMRWHTHWPTRGGASEGAEQAFGRKLQPRYRLDTARTIVAIDGDLLDVGPHQVGTSRAWVDARHASAKAGALMTLHAAYSTPSLTGAKADHHLSIGPSDLATLPDRLQLATAGGAPSGDDPVSVWLRRAASALAANQGRSLVVAGATQPAAVHEAVHRLNNALGNIGPTVAFSNPVVAEGEPLADLVAAMNAGKVDAVLLLDGNPVYTAPADLGFAAALGKVALKIHAGMAIDETALHADWHLPLAHALESWGDARAWDGTVSFLQPTIAPLYNGRSGVEILAGLTEPNPLDSLTILRNHWAQGRAPADFGALWRQSLLDGFVAGSALPEETVTLVPAKPATPPQVAHGLEIVFRPDPTVWDGSSSNNGWLQELPKPLTKIVWDNVVSVSPTLAQREKLANGDLIEVAIGDAKVTGPVWVTPGQAAETLTLFLGSGRQVPDMVSTGVGFDANPLRRDDGLWSRSGASLRKLGSAIRIATTQDHSTLEGHDLIRIERSGDPVPAASPVLPSFYKLKGGDGRAWGMVIDTDGCTGCNACVVACQAENNIPVVGKEQVAVGREMHWLRIDRYYSGLKTGAGLDDPDTHFQPVPCMHCEEAPCEVGCPVEATLHDHEGLNLMVYNRCIGTRACSGYCPYKVRHFNYLDYTGDMPAAQQLQRNPEVTVRARGVMEKCTYCVQRIAAARIEADKSGEPIPDGAVQTACQGACPTRAITFGDLAVPGSAVAAVRADARNYSLLGELNLKPRTTYLAERAPAAGTEG